ncbi:IclR family transcriptional regulator [uncultured Roseovarius sp.]|uniref:IclR family transcriptional regulator n=1 Tax=uncultured Roseovarius sp. TaxID=293344 RepID=UPI00262C4EEA|nr:IclR family transcriptional regulator [uncultured Roseovarius sp.]
MDQQSKSQSVLEKFSRLLDVFSNPPFRFSYSNVVELVSMPKSTVHRMLNQMVDLEFLERDEERREYILGPKLGKLLHYNLPRSDLIQVFKPVLLQMAQDVGETAFAARLRGNQVELFCVQSPETDGMSYVHPGKGPRPAHACSSAKAIIAFQDETFIDSVLNEPLHAFNSKTVTDPIKLKSELANVRETGFAYCREEIEFSVSSISCPISLPGAGVLYAIGTISLTHRRNPQMQSMLEDELLLAGNKLSTLLGSVIVEGSVNISNLSS